MSEPTLIREQRAILRRLRQTTAHHTQITTAADAQWQSQGLSTLQLLVLVEV